MWRNPSSEQLWVGGVCVCVCDCASEANQKLQNSSVVLRTRSNFSVSLFFSSSAFFSFSAFRIQSKQCNRICNMRDSSMNLLLKDNKICQTLSKLEKSTFSIRKRRHIKHSLKILCKMFNRFWGIAFLFWVGLWLLQNSQQKLHNKKTDSFWFWQW